MNSSPGFPWNAIGRTSKKDVMVTEILESCKKYIADKTWLEPYFIYNAFMKDELVKRGKIEKKQQRVICGDSYVHVLLTGITSCKFNDSLVHNWEQLPSRVGVSLFGGAWHRLAMALGANEDRVYWDSDFSGYEFSLAAELYWLIMLLRSSFLSSSFYQDLLAKLYEDMIFGPILFPWAVLFCFGVTRSGHGNTIIDNTIISWFLVVYGCLKQGVSLAFLIEYLRLAIIGDDVVLSMPRQLAERIDLSRLKADWLEVGVTSKGGDFWVELDHVDFCSMSFLSFKGWWVPKPTRLAKLTLSSVVYRSKSPVDRLGKCISLRTLTCFDNRLWGVVEHLTDVVVRRHSEGCSGNPQWLGLLKARASREAVQSLYLPLSEAKSDDTLLLLQHCKLEGFKEVLSLCQKE